MLEKYESGSVKLNTFVFNQQYRLSMVFTISTNNIGTIPLSRARYNVASITFRAADLGDGTDMLWYGSVVWKVTTPVGTFVLSAFWSQLATRRRKVSSRLTKSAA